ncbi:hypothetical protein [Chondromyces apiculatus]|uniref:Uncharacterized protein n=1 Tax=Chondromyces apiculatus DSM 436 TaxID=1192034 RepID=A0A017T9I6_9BACT|nr:hypothetical protein [Chondromyces apiculatus]EYF05938.1 Hypothetical protein CAP_2397 [Chondromyces apiculatus DSM 436]
MSGARKTVVSMLVMAALATTGVASAQTEKPQPQAAKQVVAGGEGGAQFMPSVLDPAPPAQLGRAWVVVLEDARQQLDALTNQALRASAQPRGVEAMSAARPQVQAEVAETSTHAAQGNETTLTRWDDVQVFGEPLLFRARGTTFGRWDAGVLPAVGVRFPLPFH